CMHDRKAGRGGRTRGSRLWVFGSFRHWGVNQAVAHAFYNLDPTHRPCKPDLPHQVIDDNRIKSGIVRLTWQATPRLKASAYLDRIIKFRGHEGSALRTEEAFAMRNPKIYYTAQVKITGTLSSRLLVEAGWSTNNET